MNRDRRRTVFDEDAALYDRAWPRYPPAVFDDLRRTTRYLTELRVAHRVA